MKQSRERSGTGSDVNKGLLRIPPNFDITGTSQ